MESLVESLGSAVETPPVAEGAACRRLKSMSLVEEEDYKLTSLVEVSPSDTG